MKKILTVIVLCMILLTNFSFVSAQPVQTKPKVIQISYGAKGHKHTKWGKVKPYTRKDGTYVPGHRRRVK